MLGIGNTIYWVIEPYYLGLQFQFVMKLDYLIVENFIFINILLFFTHDVTALHVYCFLGMN